MAKEPRDGPCAVAAASRQSRLRSKRAGSSSTDVANAFFSLTGWRGGARAARRRTCRAATAAAPLQLLSLTVLDTFPALALTSGAGRCRGHDTSAARHCKADVLCRHFWARFWASIVILTGLDPCRIPVGAHLCTRPSLHDGVHDTGARARELGISAMPGAAAPSFG